MRSRASRESRTTVRISMETIVGSEISQRLSALPYSLPTYRQTGGDTDRRVETQTGRWRVRQVVTEAVKVPAAVCQINVVQ